MTNATFTSMDVSTKEEWMNIGAETAKNQPRVAEGILNMPVSYTHLTLPTIYSV